MGLVPFDHGGFYPSDDGGAGSLYHGGSGKWTDPCTNEPGVLPNVALRLPLARVVTPC